MRSIGDTGLSLNAVATDWGKKIRSSLVSRTGVTGSYLWLAMSNEEGFSGLAWSGFGSARLNSDSLMLQSGPFQLDEPTLGVFN